MFVAHYLLSYVIFLVISRDLLATVIVITDCHGRKNLLRKIWRIIWTHFWPTVMIVKNFQTILKNLALVNTNKSTKNNISYILKRIGMCVFQEVRNIGFCSKWNSKHQHFQSSWEHWPGIAQIEIKWFQNLLNELNLGILTKFSSSLNTFL